MVDKPARPYFILTGTAAKLTTRPLLKAGVDLLLCFTLNAFTPLLHYNLHGKYVKRLLPPKIIVQIRLARSSYQYNSEQKPKMKG